MNKALIVIITFIVLLVSIVTISALLLSGTSCPDAYETETGEDHPEVTCPGCTLIAGWNNVIYKGNTENIDSAISSFSNKVTMVWYFDGIDWPFYDPAYPELSTLTTLENSKCYAFNIVSSTSW